MDIVIFFINLLFIINNCLAHKYQNIMENTSNYYNNIYFKQILK